MLDLYRHLKTQHGLNGGMLALDRLHITLDHLGDFVEFPEDTVAAACAQASDMRVAPFSISLEQVVSFRGQPGSRPLVLKESHQGNKELDLFRQALWRALAKRGVPGPSSSAFTPHVTLLYDAKAIAAQAVGPIEWVASEFVLLRSFVGETRYEELGRWPLKG